MTSNIQRGGPEAKFPGELTAIIISCDQIGCDKTVDDKEVRDGGGLMKMGWQVLPFDGKLHHYCPDHNRKI
jgi:hypothetical protein